MSKQSSSKMVSIVMEESDQNVSSKMSVECTEYVASERVLASK